jgi:hypothetical protein
MADYFFCEVTRYENFGILKPLIHNILTIYGEENRAEMGLGLRPNSS